MKEYTKEAWKRGYTPDSWDEHQSFMLWGKVITVIALGVFILCII